MSAGIYLPALGRAVPVRVYLGAVRKAKANPDAMFKHGLTTWWPTRGQEIVEQYRQERLGRIARRQPMSLSKGP